MSKKSKGCSPESARAIVALLLSEASGDALLNFNREYTPTNRKPSRPETAKVSPEMIVFVHEPERAQMKVPALQAAIMEKFGVMVSSCTIYKIWKMTPEKPKPPKQSKRPDPRRPTQSTFIG